MAGKIRIRLVMPDGAQARGLEDLREHFDLESVLGYYQDGKLVKWFRSLYMEETANKLESLDEKDPDFQHRLCDVLGVVYTGDEADLEAIQRRKERLDRLRTVTDEPDFIQHVDQVAFDQEDLADLLDEGVETIYLCGGQFTVPAAVEHVRYIGINQPDIHIDGEITIPAEEFMQKLKDCKVDNPPQHCVSETAIATSEPTTSSEPITYPAPEGTVGSCGVYMVDKGTWNCDCYAYGRAVMYGFGIAFTCLVDKDKKIKEVYAIWIPSLPKMKIQDFTQGEIETIKRAGPSTETTVTRTDSLATATKKAQDFFDNWYNYHVDHGMLKVGVEKYNYPKQWRVNCPIPPSSTTVKRKLFLISQELENLVWRRG